MQVKLLIVALLFVTNKFTPVETPDSSDKNDEYFKTEMLRLVNQIRSEGCYCGKKYMSPAPPLTWNPKLEKAAKSHAKDMNVNKFISHRGSNGSKISDRIGATNYNWSVVGENVSWGQKTVEGAVLGWKSSAGHCINLMSKEFNEIGAANEGHFWVQNFGRQQE